MLSIQKYLNLSTQRKNEIYKFLKDKTSILDSKTFDGVDTLCGVISFVLKEACDYLGVLPLEIVKSSLGKERVYLFNNEMIEHYQGKLQKLYENK